MSSLLDYATDSERQALTELARRRGQHLDDLLATTSAVPNTLSAYDRFKARQQQRYNRESLSGRDIGEIPPVVDPARRAAAEQSLRVFCESYLGARFGLQWSDDHLEVIEQIEQSVRIGGLFALAMPRGSGKTTITEAAACWGVLTGLRRFVLVVGANSKAAKAILQSIKKELATNDLLAADFPEAIYPIAQLNGLANKCKGQVYRGEQTYIEWGSEAVVFAAIPDAPCSQAIIKVAGLLSADVRGSKHKTAGGAVRRPDFLMLDDPQTDRSARSERETEARKRIVGSGLLGVAGPGQKISGIAPVTIIRRGDLADFLLDKRKSPHWHGRKYKMLHGTPTNPKAWDQFAEVLVAELACDGNGTQATEFYRAHQSELDAGLRASWPARHESHELSAIQHAMTLKILDSAVFDAEYQNDPQDATDSAAMLTPEQITRKQSASARGCCSPHAQHVTAMIDVQDDALFWMACAWWSGFSGQIIDYGVYPEFGRTSFTLRDVSGALERRYPGKGQEARWHAAIVDLTNMLARHEWRRDDGATMRTEKILVDSAYGKSTDTVYEAVRSAPAGPIVQVSRGMFFGASSTPMADVAQKPGQTLGVHWRIDHVDRRALRCVTIDTNFWKTFVHARLETPLGDQGAVSVFRAEPYVHDNLAGHLTAEIRSRVANKTTGREVDEWRHKPDRPDNHWFDCLVGCAVGASMLGVGVDGGKRSPAKASRMSFAEMQRIARERRQ